MLSPLYTSILQASDWKQQTLNRRVVEQVDAGKSRVKKQTTITKKHQTSMVNDATIKSHITHLLITMECRCMLFFFLCLSSLPPCFSFINSPPEQHETRRYHPLRSNKSLFLQTDPHQDERRNFHPLDDAPIIPITLLLLSTICSFAIPAGAVDHPADYVHLRIPNPLPATFDFRYFLSGGLCATASHGVTTPIDVVKTRMQADPLSYDKGFVDTAIRISNEGDGALLRGLGPTVVGYGLEGAAKFGLYESLKPTIANLLPLDSPTIPYLIASIIAGAVASVVLCPMEMARIRLVTDPDFASNLLTSIPKLVNESGSSGLFGGLPAMLSKQVPYTFAKQVSFDSFATFLYAAAATADLAAADVKLPVSFGAALLASVLACLFSHPGDVVLTATYQGSNKPFSTVVSQILEDRGIEGFFAGLSARFLHVGVIITSQLVLYDFIKQLLGLPATGT
jgi:solute carrier family 25 phosphate transporter 3